MNLPLVLLHIKALILRTFFPSQPRFDKCFSERMVASLSLPCKCSGLVLSNDDTLDRLVQCLKDGFPTRMELTKPTVLDANGLDITSRLRSVQVTQPMVLHVAIFDQETGFAPNPYGGFLTLGPCHWKIRLTCSPGQFFIGSYVGGDVFSVGLVKWSKTWPDYHCFCEQSCTVKIPTY